MKPRFCQTPDARRRVRALQKQGYRLAEAQRFIETELRYFAAWGAGLVRTRQVGTNKHVYYLCPNEGFKLALSVPTPTAPVQWVVLREAALDCLTAALRQRGRNRRAASRRAAFLKIERVLRWLECGHSATDFTFTMLREARDLLKGPR